MALSAASFLDEESVKPTADSFLDTPSADSFLDEPAGPPVPPAGLDERITGGAELTTFKTPLEKLKAGEFGGALADTYESLRRQVSGLLGPTEAERIENSVQWGTDAEGRPKFEYKPLGDRFTREQGLMTPYLKIEPMAKDPEDSLAKAAGKAVFNATAGLQGGLLSPGGVATGAIGAGSQAIGRTIAGGFSVDMGKHFYESAQRALAADNPQDKIEGWLSAISSLGFSFLAGTHAAGVSPSLRPAAGGTRETPRIGGPDIEIKRQAAQVAASGAPATAAALEAAATATGASERAAGPATAPEPAAGTVAPPQEISIAPVADIEGRGATTGEILEQPEILERQPATESTLPPAEYPVIERPIAGLALSKEVPNFKSDADPETGVVEGQQLEGQYERLGTGNIIEWLREDGSREVISGRHRFDLAKRNGETSIPTQIVRESEGWTAQRVARLDAEINIRDGQGTVSDYANYFRNSEGSRQEAEAGGLLARAKGRAGYSIGKLASDDLFSLFQAARISEPHTLAIVDAAQSDAGLQRVGTRYSMSNPRASAVDVGNRVKAASLVDANKADLAQGELWDSGDAQMAAMDKAASAAGQFQKEIREDVRTLEAALRKSEELKLTPAEAKKFNVHDPNSVLGIRKALERVRAEMAAWDNWHLNPEMRDAVLKRSGTEKTLVKTEPAPVTPSPAVEPAAASETDFFGGLGVEPPAPIAAPAPKPTYTSPEGRTYTPAIKLPNGRIIPGDSHSDVIKSLLEQGIMEKGDRGYVTQDGQFITNLLEIVRREEAGKLPQAAGASNINELQNQQNTFGADIFAGLQKANGAAPTREQWEPNFLRQYPELEGDVQAIDRAWTIAQEAADRFNADKGRTPMPAIIEQVMGEVRGEGVTGIRNRQADLERRRRGLPAAFQPARRSFGRVWDEAMRFMDDNPQAQDQLVQRLRDDPMAIVDDRETAMLLHRQIGLENAYDTAVDKVNRAWDARDDTSRLEAIAEAKATEGALIEILDLNKQAGTALGRGLSARRMMGRRDYSLARMIGEARAKKNGADLTPDERADIEQQHDEIVRTESALDARTADLDQQTAEKQADESIADLKVEAGQQPEYEPLVTSIAERIYQRLKKSADEARVRLRAKLTKQLGSLPDPTIIYDLAVIATEYIGRGIRAFGQWRKEMLKDWGDEVDVYLQRAWNEADKLIDRTVAASTPRKHREKVTAAVRKLDPEQVRETTTATIRERVEKGAEFEDLRALVRKLALSFVRSGLTDRNGLIDAVHGIVEPLVPGTNRRQTMDLISGYGDFAPLDKDASKATLRDLKGQMQQVAKLEDIQGRKPIVKSGVERRPIGDEERRLIAQVNEAKRKFGVVVSDPARQLKSALDAVKTRLSNQIKDLSDQIDTGTKPAAKTRVEYDEAANKLKAVRDRLQQTLDDITGKPEMSDEQRLQIATRSVEESIAEYDRRIREKDFGPQVGTSKTPPSAQLDAMKARRDALRAEFEELRATDTAWQEQKQFDALMKAGDDLQARLAAGDVASKAPGAKAADTDLVSQARERLGKLREQMRSARAATPEARQNKLNSAIQAVERSIADYTKRLETGDIDPVTKARAVSSPELDALTKDRDELKKIVTGLRQYAKPKLSPDEIAIKSLKTRYAQRIADLQGRIARGDYAPRPARKVDLSRDPAAVRLKAENDRWKGEFEKRKLLFERENRTALQRLIDLGMETLNLPRAVMSSFDVSAVLRQGGFITFGNPARAARNITTMFHAMLSERAFEKSQAELSLRPNAPLYKSSGLFLAETGDVRLSAKEEAIMSEFADRIPGVRQSNRAYVTFLNRMRADTFDAMIGSLSKRATPTVGETKAVANFINISTGRGNLGMHAQAAQTLATVFFSPRLLASRFQLLGGIASGFRFGKGATLRTRALIAKEYAKTMIGLGTVLAVGAIGGATVESDPRSSDFGKLLFGNTRVDLLMGLSQVTVFLARELAGEKKNAKGKVVPIRGDKVPYGGDTGASVLFDFGRSKLSPVLGIGVDLAAGKNLVGDKTPQVGLNMSLEDVPEVGKYIVLRSMPLSLQDIQEVMEDNEVPAGTAISLLSLFGASVQVYDAKAKKKP